MACSRGCLGSSWRSPASLERAQLGATLTTTVRLGAAGWGIFAIAILPRQFHCMVEARSEAAATSRGRR
jgi:hypothetical protein